MKKLTFIAFYAAFMTFIILTADVIRNPVHYDTVAQYHYYLESGE